MIDTRELEKLTLRRRSYGQMMIGTFFLGPNYNLPPRTRIHLEGLENVPLDHTVIFAMNHTDRYNYWPFQYKMWSLHRFPYTTTWVKAKYYGNRAISWFFNRCNNIPLPSKGYLIFQDGFTALQRKLVNDEYRILRDLLDGTLDYKGMADNVTEPLRRMFSQPRRDFNPEHENWTSYLQRWNDRLMKLVETRTLQALGPNFNNLIVFPQGTRAKRLQPGHPGLAQFALRHEIPVIPVGCMGSEDVYPGTSPLAKGGDILYRLGKEMTFADAFADCRISEPYIPFTRDVAPFGEEIQRATERITLAINDLLDAPYKLLSDTVEDNRAKAEQLI